MAQYLTKIGNLANLSDLILFHNQLSGSIPPSIGNLTNLHSLYLSYNQLSGSIPPALHKLINLGALVLEYNKLSGIIPASITQLSNLSTLFLDNNQLSGEVPASLFKIKNLSRLDISYNQLTISQNTPITHKAGLTINLRNNRFTFNGIEYLSRSNKVTYAPQAPISIHVNGSTLYLSAGGTLSNNTYIWYKAGETDSTTIVGDSTFQPAASGLYYAKVTNAMATKLTLKTDTVNYTAASLTTAKRMSSSAATFQANNKIHWLIYPNPAKEIIHVQAAGNSIITITNAAGKVVLTKNIKDNGAINISGFAAGIYYLKNTTTGEGQKIVVIH